MKQQLEVRTWHGMTPVALLCIAGLSAFAIARTALLIGCHVAQPYAACESERKDWQDQMLGVGAGFVLLFVKAPGTSEAPVATAEPLQSRRAEDEIEAEPEVIPSAVVIDPDAPEHEPELTTAERMARAAARLPRGAKS
jgi:hypothetical protein